MTEFEQVTFINPDGRHEIMVAKYLGTAQGSLISYSLRPLAGTVTLRRREIVSRLRNQSGPVQLPRLVREA